MRNTIIIGIIILIAGALVVAFLNRPPALTYADVTNDIGSGAQLYDVRTPAEYVDGHFVGAQNFPLQTMQAAQYPDVAKDTKIYVYCHSGNRSSQATALLRKAGYTNVTDLGGLSHVQSMGGELVKE